MHTMLSFCVASYSSNVYYRASRASFSHNITYCASFESQFRQVSSFLYLAVLARSLPQ